MSVAVSPLNLERYELKYLIPLELVDPISRYVETYCHMDYYSQIEKDCFYTINSLYLDSPSLYLMRAKEMAQAYSFNMRIRSYGDGKKGPYFFEIKHKVREFVRKKRAKYMNDDWNTLFEGNIPIGVDGLENLMEFLNYREVYNTGPVILTQYRRKAYISEIDDYARVTFDRDLRFQEVFDWTVMPDERMMLHYDHPESFGESGACVVLELKCEKKIPVWFVDLIRRFELMGGSFSKFGNSMLTLHNRPDVQSPGFLYR